MKYTQMEKRLQWSQIFDKSASLPKTQEEVEKWRQQIESDLSPENLTCDGEASAAAVRKALAGLKKEQKELAHYATNVVGW